MIHQLLHLRSITLYSSLKYSDTFELLGVTVMVMARKKPSRVPVTLDSTEQISLPSGSRCWCGFDKPLFDLPSCYVCR